MADYGLGTAHGQVTIGVDGTDDVRGAAKDIDDLGKSANSAAEGGINKVGTAAAVAGGAIVAGFAVAVNAATEFEARLSAIKAVSGATQSEMDNVRKKALQLGADTKYSASEAAQAMEELIKAGISVPDVMNGAADATVALAAAGEVALPRAAELSANAMNAFNLSAKDMPRVADLIAGAANASAIDVGEFGMSLSQVGAVAHLAGASFDDTAAAIALMGNAGIKGSDAGTSLKTMFQNLNPQTDKQIALARELGILTADGSNNFYDSAGNMKSMADVAQILNTSLKGMTAQQKQMALETLFGSDAIRAAAIVSDAGAAGFNKMAASMGKVTAADVAATRMDNLKGSIEQLTGSAETFAINLGSILIPAIRKVVDSLTGIVNWFNRLTPAQQQAIVQVAAVTAGFLLFTAAALKIGAAIKGLVGFIRLAGGAMKALQVIFMANPIGLVLVAVAALAAGLYLLYQRSETFRNAVQPLVQLVGGALKTAFDGISRAVGVFVAAFKGVNQQPAGALGLIATAGEKARVVLTAIGNFLSTTFRAAWAVIVPLVQRFGAFLGVLGGIFMEKVWPAIQQTAAALAEKFAPMIQKVISGVQSLMPLLNTTGGIIQKVASWIASWLVPALASIAKFVVGIVLPALVRLAGWFLGFLGGAIFGVINGAITFIKGALQIIIGVFGVFKNLFTGNWSGLWNSILMILKGVWNLITGAIQIFLNVGILKVFRVGFGVLKGIFSGAWGAIRGTTTGVLNSIKGFISSIWKGIQSFIKGVLNGIKGNVTSQWNGIRSTTTGVWNGIKNLISSVWNGIKSLISSAINTVKSRITSGLNTIKSAWSTAWNAVKTAVSRIWQGINSAVQTAISTLMGKVRNIKSSITGFFSGAASWLVGAGRSIIGGLAEGVRQAGQKVIKAAQAVVQKVKDLLPGSPVKTGPLTSLNHGHAGKEIMNMVASGMEKQLPAIEEVMKRAAFTIDPTRPSLFEAVASAKHGNYAGTMSATATRPAPLVTQHIYNPVSERTSVTTNREMQKLAAIGVI
jgi:TP901 family phage tail tape measure protein